MLCTIDSIFMEKEITVYHNYLLKVAYTKLSPALKHWAEDIVQETYIKALRYRNSFDENKSQLKTWLVTITVNLCKDFNQKKVNKEMKYDSFSFFQEPYETNSSDRAIDIRKYLKELSNSEQRIIRMKFFFNMTAKEIAVILRTKHNNIPMMYKRTLKKLHDILQDRGINGSGLFS